MKTTNIGKSSLHVKSTSAKSTTSEWTKLTKSLKTTSVQTDYRENGTQTDPWTPRFRVINGRPEVLTLGFMKTKRDLPAWKRTVDAIEFMRKKRAWERYLAKSYTPENAKFCRRIITDIEKCERKLIEEDFDRKNKKRLELAQKEAEYFNSVMDQRFKERDQFVSKQIAKRKSEKIRSIKAKKARELRKIDMRQQGVNMKYHHMTPIEEMCDPLSPFHVSIARFGKNPRYATEILDPECTNHDMKALNAGSNFKGLMRKPTFPYEKSKALVPKKHDCSVVTEDIEMYIDEDVPCSEPNARPQSLERYFSPATSIGNSDGELMKSASMPYFPTPHQEKDYQAVLLIQTLIRGRAVQNVMYKGRKMKQASINEVQSTMAFFKEEEDEVDMRRRRALQRLRYYHLNMKHMGLVALVRDEMAGVGISKLALKSHLEVERVTEEMRGYLMAQLAERTRWHREAAEAGRRQRELRRRELYDEFFKHLTRRNEITSDFYLKLIEDRVTRAIAEKEADIATRQKADEIEKKDIEDARRSKHDIVTRRETMARLLHDFYIPQIAKNLERFSMDYYIQKARKTAIDVITEQAKAYDMEIEETSLMELVNRPKSSKPYEPTQPQSNTDLDSSSTVIKDQSHQFCLEDDEELTEKIQFLQRFWKKDTMSVIKEAGILSKQADYYRNLILKKLRAQEDERRLTKFVPALPADGNEECFKHVYGYDLTSKEKSRKLSAVPAPEVSDEEVGDVEEMGIEEENESDSKHSSFSDYIDKRLLVNSDDDSTTASESEDEKNASQLYGDMPEKLIDELLMQGQVLDAMDREKVDIVELAMKVDSLSLDSYGSYGVIDDSKDEPGLTDTQQAEEPSVLAEHTVDPELLDEEARRRYQEWRDQSDTSRLNWGYHQPTPTLSENGVDGESEEGLETYPAGYEGEAENDYSYYTHESTDADAESESDGQEE